MILSVTCFIIDMYFFKGIIDNVVSVVFFTMSIVLIASNKNKITNKFFAIVNFLIITALIVFFISLMPQYTYSEARIKIYDDYKAQGKQIEFLDNVQYFTMRSNKPLSFMIHSGYIIPINIYNEVNYMFFNPISGEYFNGNDFFEKLDKSNAKNKG